MPRKIICSVCGEEKPHHAKGKCHTCYQRDKYNSRRGDDNVKLRGNILKSIERMISEGKDIIHIRWLSEELGITAQKLANNLNVLRREGIGFHLEPCRKSGKAGSLWRLRREVKGGEDRG